MLDADVQLAALAAAAAVMVAAWIVSLPLRDASVADIAWGLTFVAIALAAAAAGEGDADRSTLVAVLVAAWGLRLAGYIAWRHDGEDRRYRAMRERQGRRFAFRSLVTVFLLQAAIAWIVSLPIQVAATDPGPANLGLLDWLGALVAVAGIGFEATADAQLAGFLRSDRTDGAVMDRGLWRYSRHPNYFGDTVFWWGIWLIALATGSGWWTLVGPALMTFLLLRVSGVAMTERTIGKRRPEYARYVERTSAFVPRPPRG